MICLMPMCAYLSETSRMIQIYKALRRQGAEARIATHGGVHEALLRNEGIEFDIVGPHMSAARGAQFVRDNVGIGSPDQSMYSPEEMRAYVLAEAEYFRRHRVSAVVTGFTTTTLLSSRLAGIPLIVEHAGACIPPLFERGLLPAASRPPAPMFRYMPKALARWLQNTGMTGLRLYLSGFNALAAELGIPPIPSFPALLLGDLVLVTEAPDVYGITEAEMSAWRSDGKGAYWPSTRFVYTGPVFAEFDLPVPDAIERALTQPGPRVYVALTSAPAETVRRVVRGAAASGATVVVAATVHELGDINSGNVTVGGVLPSHKIMPRVDLAITTGGQGSVQCAMATGTPLIGIPLHREQDSNLHFVAARGAARVLPLAMIEDARLCRMMGDVLSKPAYRAAARSIQASYALRSGPDLCASAIIAYVARTQGPITTGRSLAKDICDGA
jgi:UDP:flavonoid glycosyltransferase YjiC (YdhE family)